MTERMSRAEVARFLRTGGPDHTPETMRLAWSYVDLLDENERLKAAQTTTLVACSRCGHGHRARHMVALGDERMCVECAEDELRRLRGALQDILDTSITNPRHDYGYMVWVNSHDQMVAIARTALNGGTDASGGDGEVG